MRKYITIGIDARTGRRIRVLRSIFGHMHIRGMTGSGKTSLAFLNLISQFMPRYILRGISRLDPIIVIDLGGDQSLFWNTRELATQAGRVFRFLNLDPDCESHFFPPFQAIPGGERNVIRIAQMLVQAFNLDHGLIYGGNYYTATNTSALVRVARKLTRAGGNPTLADVAGYLDDPANRREFKDADQIRMTFDFLLEYPTLGHGPSADFEIIVDRLLQNGEVAYLFVPTLDEPLTARLVAGLFLYTLINVAMRRTKRGLPRPNIRVFVDEWHEVAGRSFAALLAQSRKHGFSLFLANQSTSQLENHDASLVDAVFEGTAVKQYFTCVGQRDVRDLQALSKDTIISLGGTSTGNFTGSSSSHEIIVPKLSRDEILDWTYEFGVSVISENDGKGHREPIAAFQVHQFPDYSERAMPPSNQSQASAAATPMVSSPLSAVPLTNPLRQQRHAALKQFIAAKIRAETWR